MFHLFCRISPQSRDARSNAEEPIGEDEDVQAERIRTATALNTSIEEVGIQVSKWVLMECSGTQESRLMCWVLFRKYGVGCVCALSGV